MAIGTYARMTDSGKILRKKIRSKFFIGMSYLIKIMDMTNGRNLLQKSTTRYFDS